MYKILSIVLCAFLGALGVAFLIEKHNGSKREKELNNQLVKAEGTLKETETAYSQRAIELDGIKTENKDLQKILKDRDEKIVSLTKVNFKLKDQLSKGNNATESKTEDGRVKVEFKLMYPVTSTNPLLSISGSTTTNPPESEILLHWERGLKLNIIVAYDKETKTFRSYIDSNNSDLVPTDINFQIDPDVLRKSWYEKVSVSGGVLLGQYSAILRLGLMYDFLENFSLGPSIMLATGRNYDKYYGIDFQYYLFK